MGVAKLLENMLVRSIRFGVSLKGKEAAEVAVEKDRILIEIKSPFTAAEMAAKSYAIVKNMKKVKSRIAKASKKITVKYGVLSFDI
ncbi:MAG: hypothetical protein HYT71_03260 [Candidatus Aenigmarchaeota archaeon]|nr:hypothetical protein [Candidatus Aenigmarchaeota archaeon]